MQIHAVRTGQAGVGELGMRLGDSPLSEAAEVAVALAVSGSRTGVLWVLV